eukprot:gene16830-8300_t
MHKRQSRATPLMVQVQAGKMESYRKSSLKTDSKSGKIRLYLSEKTLHLAAKHGNAASSFFIGSFVTGSDGVFLQIDRFDPGRNIEIQAAQGFVTRRVPTAVIPGDHIISVKFIPGLCRNDTASCVADNNMMQQHIEDPLDFFTPSKVPPLFALKLRDWNFYHYSHLERDIVTFATDFEAKPIKSIPIIPTALAKNLSGPMRLSYVQGSPKFGYLTMDQTRKLLLLLENDPKVDSLPLVGIWISGVEDISHPFTWACCLKFIRADYINERVIAPPSSFLLLHYPTSKGHPDFYESQPTLDANGGKVFDLLTCKEQLVLSSKKTTSDSQNDICFDLLPIEENDAEFDVKILTLNDSVRGHFTDLSVQREVVLEGNGMPKSDASFIPIGQYKDKDDPSTPRPCPKPFTILTEAHPRTPLVPELSLIEVQPIISSTREYNPQDYQENGTPESRNDVSQASVRSGQARIQPERRTMPKDLLDISNSDINFGDGVEDSCFIKRTVAHQGTVETDQDDGTNDANNSDATGKVAQNNTTKRDQLVTAQRTNEALIGTEERGAYRDNHDSRITSATANCAMQTDTLSVIAEHERQLFELRDQIRVLLQQKQNEELRRDELAKVDTPKAEISTQCSLMESRKDAISIGINTGESLIWNGRDPSEGALSCSCCEKCKRKIRRSRPSQTQQSLETFSLEVNQDCPILTPNNGNHEKTPDVIESYSLSEIKCGDIHVHSLSENNMSASMQSFASDFNAVDLPVFDDSQNIDPNSPDDVELGASASMIYEQVNQNQVSLNHSTKSSNHSGDHDQHTGSADEEEANFYKQMVEDVKDLLNDQVETNKETLRLENIDDPSDFRDLSRFSNSLEEGNGVNESTRQHDVLVDKLEMGALNATDAESRLVPRDGAVFHPRINYVSLLGNDTGDEANILADEIAMKYLTSNQVRDVKLNVTQKTKSVKFEGDVAGALAGMPAGMPRINMNYVSVNVSCNMSIATKRYMQRYNLLESQPVANLQLPNRHGPSAKDAAVRNTSTKQEDKENNKQFGKILDLKKLKGLSKLS